MHDVLVELAYFNNYACLVPFGGVRSGLILDPYVVTNYQWLESFSVLCPFLSCLHVPVPQCFSGG